MTDHYIAFWNLENLFDIENSTDRPAWFQKTIKGELKGWNATVLKKKIACLKSIIELMNDGQGPDVLGVCEVENKIVLQKLLDAISIPGRKYKIAHHNTSDKRGIDVAFIYDFNLFKAEDQFFHIIQKRSATRDLFQVNFRSKANGKVLVMIGNHWPSRSAGEMDSEPYRIMAGETLSYFHERILEELGPDTAVLAMGDFNDEPFNRSIEHYALSSRLRSKVMRGRNPYFLNLMWPMMGTGRGSHFYGGHYGVLDQIMVNKAMLNGKGGYKALTDTARIEAFAEMSSSGTNPAPVRFGRPYSKGKPNSNFTGHGFSDHYPVSVRVRET